MRVIIVAMILGLFSFGLRANESAGGDAGEPTDTTSAANEAVDSESSEDRPPPPPVEVRNPNDSFLPTDQLRYDQEVDYPTDI